MSSSFDPQSPLLGEILARARRDPEFRARLLRDPAAALRDELGLRIPASYRVLFVEKEGGDELIVQPAAPSDELSDEQLEDVAGGAPPRPSPGDPAFWAH